MTRDRGANECLCKGGAIVACVVAALTVRQYGYGTLKLETIGAAEGQTMQIMVEVLDSAVTPLP